MSIFTNFRLFFGKRWHIIVNWHLRRLPPFSTFVSFLDTALAFSDGQNLKEAYFPISLFKRRPQRLRGTNLVMWLRENCWKVGKGVTSVLFLPTSSAWCTNFSKKKYKVVCTDFLENGRNIYKLGLRRLGLILHVINITLGKYNFLSCHHAIYLYFKPAIICVPLILNLPFIFRGPVSNNLYCLKRLICLLHECVTV